MSVRLLVIALIVIAVISALAHFITGRGDITNALVLLLMGLVIERTER